MGHRGCAAGWLAVMWLVWLATSLFLSHQCGALLLCLQVVPFLSLPSAVEWKWLEESRAFLRLLQGRHCVSVVFSTGWSLRGLCRGRNWGSAWLGSCRSFWRRPWDLWLPDVWPNEQAVLPAEQRSEMLHPVLRLETWRGSWPKQGSCVQQCWHGSQHGCKLSCFLQSYKGSVHFLCVFAMWIVMYLTAFVSLRIS